MVRHPSLCKTCNNSCGPSPGVFATDHAGHCSLAFPVPGKTQVKLQMVSRTVILSLHMRVRRLAGHPSLFRLCINVCRTIGVQVGSAP